MNRQIEFSQRRVSTTQTKAENRIARSAAPPGPTLRVCVTGPKDGLGRAIWRAQRSCRPHLAKPSQGWLPSRLKAGYKREGIAPAAVELGRVLINPVLDRGSTNVRFASKATELLRRRQLTRMGWTGRAPTPNHSEDDRRLRSTRSTSLCPIRQPLQSFTPLASIQVRTPCI